MPSDDPTLIFEQWLFARIVGGLGGTAAEEMIFGELEIITGAAGDMQQIIKIARQVCYKKILVFSIQIAEHFKILQ